VFMPLERAAAQLKRIIGASAGDLAYSTVANSLRAALAS